ncbi:MAG: hypothetical protein Q9170_005320 [Blastenia crenularia]
MDDYKRSQHSPMSDDKQLSHEEKFVGSNESSDKVISADDGSTVGVITQAAERELTREFDLRILPVLAIMYLFNSLDKSNFGNAKTNGLEKSLNLKNSQYNTILSVFFVPYVLTAPVLAILGKNFYRRGELARRLAIFYAAQSIASAFSGLLAFGVFQIHTGSLPNWRYVFVIEGCCTVLFSFFAFFYLPQSASTAKFLSQSEKELAHYRMQVDNSSVCSESEIRLQGEFQNFQAMDQLPDSSH